jgi:hypothetical protein
MLIRTVYIFLFTVAFFLHSAAISYFEESASKPAECKSYISILGSSNINQFRIYNENLQIDATPEIVTEDNLIRIPVYDFKASNNRMLSDFYDMVKAEDYPYIDIAIEPRGQADFDEQSGLTNFRTEVTIAGKSNSYIVPSEISGCEHNGFILKGNLQVKLTDFNIEPPTKVFGAVKVNDNVSIKFAFRMQHDEVLSEQVQE